MKYTVSTEGRYTIITLDGDVDLHSSPQARKQVLHYLNNNHNIAVDLSGVGYIDSSGIATLVEGFQLSRKKRRQFALVGVSGMVTKVIQLARLDAIFPIYNSVNDLLANNQ
ncbi:MAG: STAS domain-containing protein [bacterium]